jgi:hypothetical protein
MTIIIEDGSIVENANSLATRAEAIAHALTFGITLTDDSTTDILLIKAMKYFVAIENQLKGYRVDRAQTLAYPRAGVKINGFVWESDEIPTEAKTAQLELVLDLNEGVDLYNRQYSKGAVIEEAVDGAVNRKYADTSTKSVSTNIIKTRGTEALKPLLKNVGLMSVELVRG